MGGIYFLLSDQNRVVIIVLTMLVIIPLLTVSDNDQTQSFATTMVHRAAFEVYFNGDAINFMVCLPFGR